jgi:hypothetical protein
MAILRGDWQSPPSLYAARLDKGANGDDGVFLV